MPHIGLQQYSQHIGKKQSSLDRSDNTKIERSKHPRTLRTYQQLGKKSKSSCKWPLSTSMYRTYIFLEMEYGLVQLSMDICNKQFNTCKKMTISLET